MSPGSKEEAALEALTRLEIDGHPAFAWEVEEGSYRSFTALVLAEDATFIVSIGSLDPAFSTTRQLRAAVESFRRDPFAISDILVPAGAALLLVAVGWSWWRRRSP